MNWVDRLFAREQNLKDATRLWSDVCAAISSAVASWNRHYRKDGTQIEIIDTDEGSRIRIAVPTTAGTVTIDVNLNGNKFIARYSNGVNSRTFHIEADHESAYIKCGSEKCDADEVSRRVLEPALRPETLSGPRSTPVL